MEKYTLNVKNREEKTPKQLRREGKIPATLYGPAVSSESLQFSERDFSKLPVGAFSHLVDLNMEAGKPVSVIIRKVHRRAVSGEIMNVEFYRVDLKKKLTVEIPIKFVGSAPAVAAGAQLFEVSQHVEIECLPSDIPDFVEADLSTLEEFDTVLHFSELKMPEGVKILNPLDGVVAKAVSPRVVEEEEAAAETEEGAAVEGEGATEDGAAAEDGAKKEEAGGDS